MSGVMSVSAPAAAVTAMSWLRRSASVSGRLARTSPSSTPTLPPSTRAANCTGFSSSRPSTSSARWRARRSMSPLVSSSSKSSSSSTRRTHAARTFVATCTTPRAGTTTSPTPWTGDSCVCTTRRPSLSGRSVRTSTRSQFSSSIRSRAVSMRSRGVTGGSARRSSTTTRFHSTCGYCAASAAVTSDASVSVVSSATGETTSPTSRTGRSDGAGSARAVGSSRRRPIAPSPSKRSSITTTWSQRHANRRHVVRASRFAHDQRC
ncbi:hypothetical protein HMPREF0321_1332 [Dermacoccus sp. Ellin185]|nr:hypothetical protein HMPREF0321_1332 [Dermacoccus sp. Ellin185]